VSAKEKLVITVRNAQHQGHKYFYNWAVHKYGSLENVQKAACDGYAGQN